MTKLTVRTLKDGEKMDRFSEAILLKKDGQTFVYDVTDLKNVTVSDILSRVFEDISVETFDVSCSEDQNFLAGLTGISGFQISGTLTDGSGFEISFDDYYLEADDLLIVENDSNYIGIEEYGDRTTEWVSESSVDKESELYKTLMVQAEKCNMDISELDNMLDSIAEHCSGSDVEY